MRKLLIAEDTEATKLGLNILYQDRYETRVAGTCEEVREILSGWQPDLAIIDISLPVSGGGLAETVGFRLVDEIKAIHRDIGIVLYSAYTDMGETFYTMIQENGYRGLAYVLKGSRSEILENALEEVRMGRNYVDSNITCKRIPVQAFLFTLSDEEQRAVENAARAVAHLSSRERDVFKLMACSYENNQIARKLDLALPTVETHITKIYSTLVHQSVNEHGLSPRMIVTKAYILNKILQSA